MKKGILLISSYDGGYGFSVFDDGIIYSIYDDINKPGHKFYDLWRLVDRFNVDYVQYVKDHFFQFYEKIFICRDGGIDVIQ